MGADRVRALRLEEQVRCRCRAGPRTKKSRLILLSAACVFRRLFLRKQEIYAYSRMKCSALRSVLQHGARFFYFIAGILARQSQFTPDNGIRNPGENVQPADQRAALAG